MEGAGMWGGRCRRCGSAGRVAGVGVVKGNAGRASLFVKGWRGEASRGLQQDEILVIIGRHAVGDAGASRIGEARLYWLRLVIDAAVAAMAVEEGKFGEHPLGPALRLEQRQAAFERGRLPDRPDRKSTRLNSSH